MQRTLSVAAILPLLTGGALAQVFEDPGNVEENKDPNSPIFNPA